MSPLQEDIRSAVLGVNVVVAAMLTPGGIGGRILSALESRRFSLLISEGMVAEIERKLHHPKVGGAYGVTREDIVWVRGLLLTQPQMVLVGPQDVLSVTGDPEDDYVLATSRLGRAQYLVTGDKGLLALQDYAGANIVTPRQFLDGLA